VAGAALLALAAGSASATTTVSVPLDSPFDGDAEGWTVGASEYTSLLSGLSCIPGVTCPMVFGSYQAGGGGDGSGYIETGEIGILATGLLTESSGTWESPEFTYLGVAGERPTKVELTLARQAQLTSLLALPGSRATYTVELVDQTTPAGTVMVTNRAPLPGAEEWKRTSTEIAPSVLAKGDGYKVRIRTAFVVQAAVVPGGSVAYDDVKLTASREVVDALPKDPEDPAGPGGGNGGDGKDGSNGGKGAGEGKGSNDGKGAGDGKGADDGKGANGRDGANGGGAAGRGGAAGSQGRPGGKGATGTEGARGLSAAELRTAIGSQGVAATASLRRGKLVVTGRCPRRVRGACTVRVQGMLDRRTAATASGRAKIGAGRRHRFVVAVNPRARPALARLGKLLVKEWVRVGKARVTLYRQLRLVPLSAPR